jgi:Flp pilus assembly pilin Flp
MLHLLSRLRVDEVGEVAISYSLVAALVSIAALIAMTVLGDTIPEIYNFVTGTMIEGLQRVGL